MYSAELQSYPAARPRRSRLLDQLRRGRPVLSYKLNSSCPRIASLAAMSGFDAIWICNEHVPSDWSTLERQIDAAKVFDVDTIVRVAKGCYSDYIRPLEADAAAIMVPHLMSLAEARELVRMIRFQPLGRRPLDGGNADGMFCRMSTAEYIEFANANRMVIVQIEDPEPLSELDEICRLDGIDMIFFGPGDFSHAIGCPGELNHPEVVRARRLVVETARRHGKFAGTVSGAAGLRENLAMGYQLLNCGADVTMISSGCDAVVKAFGEAANG